MQLSEFLGLEFTPYEIKRFRFWKVKCEPVIEILKSFNFDYSKYSHEIDSYGLKHVRSRHASGKFGVTNSDFFRIPYILEYPDSVHYTRPSDINTHIIKYTKNINGTTYHYLEEIRTGKKTLSMKTFYKTKEVL
jgi:hypothetical protein